MKRREIPNQKANPLTAEQIRRAAIRQTSAAIILIGVIVFLATSGILVSCAREKQHNGTTPLDRDGFHQALASGSVAVANAIDHDGTPVVAITAPVSSVEVIIGVVQITIGIDDLTMRVRRWTGARAATAFAMTKVTGSRLRSISRLIPASPSATGSVRNAADTRSLLEGLPILLRNSDGSQAGATGVWLAAGFRRRFTMGYSNKPIAIRAAGTI